MFELLEKGVGASALTRPPNIEYHRVFETAKETGDGLLFLLPSWKSVPRI